MRRRVFISWSGKRSQAVAIALRDWLPDILQNADPFVSEEDIAKGQRGSEVITSALRDSTIGIICLTPENVAAPWILFEAGALSNSLAQKDMVCPYLLGLQKTDVELPLAQFQLTSADKPDTRRLVHAINASFEGEYRVSSQDLDRRFEKWWPDLETALGQAWSANPTATSPKRSQEEILAEVLDTVRLVSRQVGPLYRSLAEDWESDVEEPDEDDSLGLTGGTRVQHPVFGAGTVRLLTGAGKDVRAVIDFDTQGRKRVVVRYANLTVLSS